MTIAGYEDKELLIDILCKSFEQNTSVNYVVKQDHRRERRIKNLMEYSFEMCYAYGNIYISENKQGCALMLFPEKKKGSVKSAILDVKLIFNCIGLVRLRKIIERDSKIESFYPREPFIYLWFIGVIPEEQQKGTGSDLLNAIIRESEKLNRPIYLETSKKENLIFYSKFGFTTYAELDFGHTLFLVKRNSAKQTHLTR